MNIHHWFSLGWETKEKTFLLPSSFILNIHDIVLNESMVVCIRPTQHIFVSQEELYDFWWCNAIAIVKKHQCQKKSSPFMFNSGLLAIILFFRLLMFKYTLGYVNIFRFKHSTCKSSSKSVNVASFYLVGFLIPLQDRIKLRFAISFYVQIPSYKISWYHIAFVHSIRIGMYNFTDFVAFQVVQFCRSGEFCA